MKICVGVCVLTLLRNLAQAEDEDEGVEGQSTALCVCVKYAGGKFVGVVKSLCSKKVTRTCWVYIYFLPPGCYQVSIVTDMSLGTANAVSMASKCERERERDKDDQKSIKDFCFFRCCRRGAGRFQDMRTWSRESAIGRVQ